MICDYEAVIGIEVHVELKTATKAFCSCSAEYGGAPNTKTCPICLGAPGTLPILNKRAFELAAVACLATGCEISRVSHFDRKNYFYPDLPKGYQITQNDTPLGKNGFLEIHSDGCKKRIGITRIHFEEDAGKLIHNPEEGYTYIDYNRCGIPLVEIVSEPDMRSSEDAKSYVAELRRVLLFAGVSDCKMNEGSMRCDVNVSLRKRGETEFGARCEIKNLNSINFVGRAIEAEVKRQAAILDSGGKVNVETRRYSESNDTTERMRDKESAAEYRFIREPDLPAVLIEDRDIERLRESMGAPYGERIDALMKNRSLSLEDARLICGSRNFVDYYEAVASRTERSEIAANLFIGEILPNIKDDGNFIPPEWFAEVVDIFASGRLSSTGVKKLIGLLGEERKPPEELIKIHSLEKLTDGRAIRDMIEEAARQYPKVVEDIKRGKMQAKKAIVGAVMRISKGRADPIVVSEEADEYFKRMMCVD